MLEVPHVPQVTVTAKEHGVITVTTAVRHTLFLRGSQTHDLSHIVENGISLTKLGAVAHCILTCPNFLGSRGTKSRGQVPAASQGMALLPAPLCKDPLGLEHRSVPTAKLRRVTPAWSRVKEPHRVQWPEDTPNTRRSPLPLLLPPPPPSQFHVCLFPGRQL